MQDKFEQLIADLTVIIDKAQAILKETKHSLLLINIADEYKTTTALIKADSRKQPLPDCRAIFAYQMHTRHNLKIVDIAKILNRHHSSVLAMIARYNNLKTVDTKFSNHLANIINSTYK